MQFASCNGSTSKARGKSKPALGCTGLEAPQCPPPAAPAGSSSSAGDEDVALAEPSQRRGRAARRQRC